MNDLPLRYLACLYGAGGLIVIHGLLHVFGFGHRAGLQRHPHRGPNVLYDAVTASYVVVAALLAFGSIGIVATLRDTREPDTIALASGVALVVLLAGLGVQRFLRSLAERADAGHINTLVG